MQKLKETLYHYIIIKETAAPRQRVDFLSSCYESSKFTPIMTHCECTTLPYGCSIFLGLFMPPHKTWWAWENEPSRLFTVLLCSWSRSTSSGSVQKAESNMLSLLTLQVNSEPWPSATDSIPHFLWKNKTCPRFFTESLVTG